MLTKAGSTLSLAAVLLLSGLPATARAQACPMCQVREPVFNVCVPAPPGIQCRVGDCASNGICDGAGGCVSWGLLPVRTVCRSAAGDCDVAETCTGSSVACPADTLRPSSFTCRAANGTCDVAETCTGSSAACPADTLRPSSFTCRAANGTCDVAETCTGTSAACPADGFRPSSFTCRAANGTCDVAETCTGTSVTCPADALRPSTFTCRAANGTCDVAETCTGTSAVCPADGFRPSTLTCRAAAGDCDVAETCTGTSAACPADGFRPGTLTCRAAAGDCDVAETCTGTSGACPADGFRPPGTVCRLTPPERSCGLTETCTGTSAACPPDIHKAASTICRAAGGQCDTAERCTGTSDTCPDDAMAGDGIGCENVSACVSGGECGRGLCIGGRMQVSFRPEAPVISVDGTEVGVLHGGQGAAISLTGAAVDPPDGFAVVAAPSWPASLEAGGVTSVTVRLIATVPGLHEAALVISASNCADLTVPLTGTIEKPPGPKGGCTHGGAGLLALAAPLLALWMRRSRRPQSRGLRIPARPFTAPRAQPQPGEAAAERAPGGPGGP